ncbi:MAG: RNA methyltransferase [Pseudomonadota bacterium]
MLGNVRIVLVGTSHPGNIGAAARAMMNMGLSDLSLVQPEAFPHPKATARASGAVGILENATCHDSLADAISGCTRVYGTSARHRSLAWPEVSARECGIEIAGEWRDEPCAIVFGRERTGLTNAELDLCHVMLHIPCNPAFSSLNIAAAVQVIAYELRMADVENKRDLAAVDDQFREDLATRDDMDQFHTHLTSVITQTGFYDPNNPKQLSRRLYRFFNRAAPDKTEINIMRGILKSVEKTIKNK